MSLLEEQRYIGPLSSGPYTSENNYSLPELLEVRGVREEIVSPGGIISFANVV